MIGRFAAFTGLAFAWSWAWWLPLTFRGEPVAFGDAAPAYVAGIPGPFFAAVCLVAAKEGRAGLRTFFWRLLPTRRAAPWCVAAALAPAGLLGVAILLTGAPAEPASFGTAPGLPHLSVLALCAYAVLWNGLGEEAGWRGYGVPLLLERFGPLGASVLVSVAWAVWHLPLLPVLTSFAVVASPAMLPVFWFGLACLSVVLTWFFLASGQNILVVALWHGTYNVAAGTVAAQGGINVVFTVFVMVWAVVVVVGWVRRRVPRPV
ncbi:CAAX protease self-immunity [Promicromonospora umidemergens]|uniref:Type II CAAX endopeptidase family protein n=1 Tax=Promicromonospora umidemergens TaxID=629679 RepID=A0ABP8Y1H4_9MICO|nr:CPBP family intramembrane glutamic endopeptidase [Promicromonospora umidemergens]MCP2286324.1 CAAX protease self-immunity [Promicromonospora umidemergens]